MYRTKKGLRNMKFTVVGGGAVGLLLASYLAGQGDVTIVVRRREQQEALEAFGITRVNGEQATTYRVEVATTIQSDAAQHIFICTKAYALQTVIAQLQHIEYASVIGCQNGLAHIDALKQLRHSYACVVEFGALKESDTRVVHTGIGRIVIGGLTTMTAPFIAATEALPVEYSDDIEKIVWRKALLNCFINPLTAVMRVKNGALVENAALQAIVEQLYAELGQALPRQMQLVTLQDVQMLCEKTAANYSSMYVDVQQQRQTEVEEIVGAVLQHAQQPVPTLFVLYKQIQAMR